MFKLKPNRHRSIISPTGNLNMTKRLSRFCVILKKHLKKILGIITHWRNQRTVNYCAWTNRKIRLSTDVSKIRVFVDVCPRVATNQNNHLLYQPTRSLYKLQKDGYCDGFVDQEVTGRVLELSERNKLLVLYFFNSNLNPLF